MARGQAPDPPQMADTWPKSESGQRHHGVTEVATLVRTPSWTVSAVGPTSTLPTRTRQPTARRIRLMTLSATTTRRQPRTTFPLRLGTTSAKSPTRNSRTKLPSPDKRANYDEATKLGYLTRRRRMFLQDLRSCGCLCTWPSSGW